MHLAIAVADVLLPSIETYLGHALVNTTNRHHESLLPDNSGSGWENVLLAQLVSGWGGGGGVAIRMSWYAFFTKINSTSIPNWRVGVDIG